MSRVIVCEVAELAGTQAQEGAVSILPTPSLAEYAVIVSAGSSGGPAFQPTTKWIEVSTDTTCSVVVGPAPGQPNLTTGVAGTSNRRLNANDRITLRVPVFAQSVVAGVLTTLAQYALFTTANA